MASVVYPNGSPIDHKPYQVKKDNFNFSGGAKVFHQGCEWVIIAKGNIYEGIEALK